MILMVLKKILVNNLVHSGIRVEATGMMKGIKVQPELRLMSLDVMPTGSHLIVILVVLQSEGIPRDVEREVLVHVVEEMVIMMIGTRLMHVIMIKDVVRTVIRIVLHVVLIDIGIEGVMIIEGGTIVMIEIAGNVMTGITGDVMQEICGTRGTIRIVMQEVVGMIGTTEIVMRRIVGMIDITKIGMREIAGIMMIENGSMIALKRMKEDGVVVTEIM